MTREYRVKKKVFFVKELLVFMIKNKITEIEADRYFSIMKMDEDKQLSVIAQVRRSNKVLAVYYYCDNDIKTKFVLRKSI